MHTTTIKTSQQSAEKVPEQIREAARLLNISERTLYARTADGSIAVVRIGNRGIRYDPADLRRWIERAKNSEESA